MPDITFQWTSKDGLQLVGPGCHPAGPPAAVVYLVHGLGEHHGRYDEVARFLNQAGFSLFASDQRGHGKSEGRRGHTPNYKTMMMDLQSFLALPQTQTAGPRFLYGHSFGGGEVLNYLLRYKPDFTGAIVCSPLLQPAFKLPAWKRALITVLGRLFPALSIRNGVDAKGISRDPEEVRRYESDALIHDQVSLTLGRCVFEGGRYALEHAQNLSIPLLLMHGEADPITFPESSRSFSEKAGVLCELHIWKNGYHELHHEPERDEILRCIVEWIAMRVSLESSGFPR